MKSTIKISSYLAVAMLLLASGCTKEPLYGGDDPSVPDGKVLVHLYTNAEKIGQPAARAAADESAVTGGGSMPWVFVFEGSGPTANFIEVKQAVLSGTPPVPRVMLSRKSSDVEILVIANAPANFHNGTASFAFNETNLVSELSGKTLAQAKALIRTIDVATSGFLYDGSYLPMVGTTSLPSITNTSSIGTNGSKLALKRIVAKITVTESADNFSIDNWTTVKIKKNCLLFDETVAAGNLIDYPSTLLSTTGETQPIYVYASPAGETFAIVKATYNGFTNQYYKLAIKDLTTGSILPVERNKWYKINITSVLKGGHSTFSAAVGAPAASNADITATVSVVDLDSYDITDNGQYYLGVTNSQLLFYGLPSGIELPYKALTVSTNATSAMAGGIQSVTLRDITPAGTLTLVSGTNVTFATGTTAAATDIKLQTIDASFVSAKIVIRVGDLIQTIEVNKASDALSDSEGAILLNFQGSNIYTTAEVTSTPGWLTISSDGTNDFGISYTQPNAAALTPVYIKVQGNTTADSRAGEVFLSRATQGRVKAYIGQNLGCGGTMYVGYFGGELVYNSATQKWKYEQPLYVQCDDASTSIPLATATGPMGVTNVWDGRGNTWTLNNLSPTNYPAANLCFNKNTPAPTSKGDMDWYLPAKNQLVACWVVHNSFVSPFDASYYWSVTEYTTDNAWVMSFNMGYVATSSTGANIRLRCVKETPTP